MPGATLVESIQRVAPVLQSMTPLLQGAPGFDVQALPAVHMPQKPFASQTCPAPQLVPAAFGAPSTQVCAPVAHDNRPCLHAEPGLVVHAPPAVHATHIPVAVQTWLVPHVVPAGFKTSSTHTGAPLGHSMIPRRHALPGLVVQDAPAVHATQVPVVLQT